MKALIAATFAACPVTACASEPAIDDRVPGDQEGGKGEDPTVEIGRDGAAAVHGQKIAARAIEGRLAMPPVRMQALITRALSLQARTCAHFAMRPTARAGVVLRMRGAE